jgi:hypothetical protein
MTCLASGMDQARFPEPFMTPYGRPSRLPRSRRKRVQRRRNAVEYLPFQPSGDALQSRRSSISRVTRAMKLQDPCGFRIRTFDYSEVDAEGKIASELAVGAWTWTCSAGADESTVKPPREHLYSSRAQILWHKPHAVSRSSTCDRWHQPCPCRERHVRDRIHL